MGRSTELAPLLELSWSGAPRKFLELELSWSEGYFGWSGVGAERLENFWSGGLENVWSWSRGYVGWSGAVRKCLELELSWSEEMLERPISCRVG
jgi:hypothetical protein